MESSPIRSVSVLGAGGHGRVVASALRASGHHVGGFYDDDPRLWGRLVDGVAVLGPIIGVDRSAAPRAVIAIGDNATRQRIEASLDLEWVTVQHPASWVAPEATVGSGTVLCAGAIVQPGAAVAGHVILNTNTVVDHDARVDDYAHISAAHLGAGSVAERGVLLGLGSVVLPDVRIGAWATVGAGAVVVSDVHSGDTVVGIPARPIQNRRLQG